MDNKDIATGIRERLAQVAEQKYVFLLKEWVEIAVAALETKGGTMRQDKFETWWARDGRYIDPDTSDVDWFDKRKELAAIAFAAALKSAPQEPGGWQPIASAPKDGMLVWVYAAEREELPAFQTWCAYDPDAGWCVDELREVTHWMPLPAPPVARTDAPEQEKP